MDTMLSRVSVAVWRYSCEQDGAVHKLKSALQWRSGT